MPQAAGQVRTPLVVAGLGNIGSHLVPHLGRMRSGGRVTLVDRDSYEEKNLRSQDMRPSDIGRAKAVVQARRLRRLDPAVAVNAVAGAVEHLPLGVLRGAVVLGCLDSRAARRRLAAAAWHAGAVAYIDAGVEPTAMLVRIDVYVPGAGGPCFECTWDAADYAAQEQQYPCDLARGPAVAPSVAATDAPSSLGALAAALQAIECRKQLDGRGNGALAGGRLVLDASWHKHYVTRLRRSPHCRFDHHVWPVEALAADATLGAVLALGRADGALRVPGHVFVRRLCCPACGGSRALLRLLGRVQAAARRCGRCGAPMQAAGFDLVERLGGADISPGRRERTLRRLGLRPGDIVAVSDPSGDRYFELRDTRTGDSSHAQDPRQLPPTAA